MKVLLGCRLRNRFVPSALYISEVITISFTQYFVILPVFYSIWINTIALTLYSSVNNVVSPLKSVASATGSQKVGYSQAGSDVQGLLLEVGATC
jgi:hypothetical protein